jgi:hypothetical protein
LPGTCSKYSNSAIPQLTSAAMIHGRVSSVRKWPYHAKVMKTFDADSRTMVRAGAGIDSIIGRV